MATKRVLSPPALSSGGYISPAPPGGFPDSLSLPVSLTAGGGSSLEINLSQFTHSSPRGCEENDQGSATKLVCSVNQRERERETTKSPFKYLSPLRALLLSHGLTLKISMDISMNSDLREMSGIAKNITSGDDPGSFLQIKPLHIFPRGCLSSL